MPVAVVKALEPDNVKWIIVHASMTEPSASTLSAWKSQRKEEGHVDLGFHYLIDREGWSTVGVPIDKAGSHTPRYASTSIGVLLLGGINCKGKPESNFSLKQFISLNSIIGLIRTKYPNAVPVGFGDLYKGENPCFNVKALIGDLNDTN